jgi:hypothetical protein
VRRLLTRAAELNGTGDHSSARALLADILVQAPSLAGLFDGDEFVAECALREAFKQGTSYFVGIKPRPRGQALDFYEEWDTAKALATRQPAPDPVA